MNKRYSVLVIALLLMFIFSAGCNETPKVYEGPIPVALYDESSGFDILHGTYKEFTVTIKNDGTEPMYDTTFEFYYSWEGTYFIEPGVVILRPTEPIGTLKPGESEIRVVRTFDIPMLGKNPKTRIETIYSKTP